MIRNVQNRKFHDSYFFNLRKCLFRIFLDGHFWNHLAKSKKNPEKNDLPVFIKEFAKLRAFGAHVPYMSICLRVLNYYVSTCIRALIFHVPTCLYIFFVPKRLHGWNCLVLKCANFWSTVLLYQLVHAQGQ